MSSKLVTPSWLSKLDPKKRAGVIAGITLGVLVVLGVTGFLVYWFAFRKTESGFKSVFLTFGNDRAFSDTGSIVPNQNTRNTIIAPGDKVTLSYDRYDGRSIPVKWDVLVDNDAPKVIIDNYALNHYEYTVPADLFVNRYRFKVLSVANPRENVTTREYKVEPMFHPTNGIGHGPSKEQIAANQTALITFEHTTDFLLQATYKFELSTNNNFNSILYTVPRVTFTNNTLGVPLDVPNISQNMECYWRLTSTNLKSAFNKDHEIVRISQSSFLLVPTGGNPGGTTVKLKSFILTLSGQTSSPGFFPYGISEVDARITYDGAWDPSANAPTFSLTRHPGDTGESVSQVSGSTITNTNQTAIIPLSIPSFSSHDATMTVNVTVGGQNLTLTTEPYIFQVAIIWNIPNEIHTVYGKYAYFYPTFQTVNQYSYNGISFQESCLVPYETTSLNIPATGYTNFAFSYSNTNVNPPPDARFKFFVDAAVGNGVMNLLWYASVEDMTETFGFTSANQSIVYMWISFKDNLGQPHKVVHATPFTVQSANVPSPTYHTWWGSYDPNVTDPLFSYDLSFFNNVQPAGPAGLKGTQAWLATDPLPLNGNNNITQTSRIFAASSSAFNNFTGSDVDYINKHFYIIYKNTSKPITVGTNNAPGYVVSYRSPNTINGDKFRLFWRGSNGNVYITMDSDTSEALRGDHDNIASSPLFVQNVSYAIDPKPYHANLLYHKALGFFK